MFEIFKTALLLSAMGAGATLVMIVLKPFAMRRFPASWQRALWVVVTAAMLVPVWRFIPRPQPKIPIASMQAVTTPQTEAEVPAATETPVIIEDTPMEYREIAVMPSVNIRLYDLAAYIWLAGVCIFLIAAFLSYFAFLIKKRRTSVNLAERGSFDEIKRELKIRRNIRIRVCTDASPPMLVGTVCPVIYIPAEDMSAEEEKMVFRHELTHYRHGDLLIKWLTMLVNAVHWFNPFAYLLSANVNEACEVACDMAVIKDMDEREQRFYMETILAMLEKGKKR